MNDFHFLYRNLTDQSLITTPEMDTEYARHEGLLLNISGIVADNWAKSLGSCWKFEYQIQEDLYFQKERYGGSFILMIQSFVFNLLEESI